MMLIENFDDGVRPAGPSTHCFYCDVLKGGHDDSCVLVKRTVVLSMTVEYVVDLPRSWTVEDIEFHRNESTYCKDNEVDYISRMRNCLCCRGTIKFVREATREDHEEMVKPPLMELGQ